MSKIIIFLSLTIILTFNACDLNEGPTLFYRHIVTVETNLDSLNISDRLFDNTNVLPDTLLNLFTTSSMSSIITIYPVVDTGIIHFNMYRGQGYDSVPNTNFIDSLTIYTPIDTTIVVFRSGGGSDAIIINPSY